jgi:hypothetical protein
MQSQVAKSYFFLHTSIKIVSDFMFKGLSIHCQVKTGQMLPQFSLLSCPEFLSFFPANIAVEESIF